VLIDNAEPRVVLADDEFRSRLPRTTSIADTMTGQRREWDSDRPEPDRDAVYALVYTSGTTGTPKGVMITHRSTMAVAGNYRRLLDLHADDVTVIHLPFSYVSGHISQLNPFMLAGGSAVVMPRFSPKTLIAWAREHATTVLDIVPWMFSLLLREAQFTPQGLPSLRAVIFGGSPMPESLLAAVRERFPALELFDVYGMSETAGMITIRDAKRHPSPGGAPIHDVQVRVADDQELEVRGDVITPGYWRNPQTTARVLRNGWLRTGDRAAIRQDGTVVVHGRVAEQINRAGVKIAPEDVEHVLEQHPGVAEAAAYGIADGAAGEYVAAAVVLRPGAYSSETELAAWARSRLPLHARPRTIRFIDVLPRNPLGKVDRQALRQAQTG
jgi:acyl-CoA synthetase (AMP-forming)/AMP-acid ligase II